MKNNYLLIDYGNSYIKACIFDADADRIVETVQVPKTINARELFSLFRFLGDRKPSKVVESITSVAEYVQPFNKQIEELLKADIRVVSQRDFKDVLDLSNIKKDVFIGSDILLSAYYASKTLKDSCVFCFGTAYFGLVIKNNQIANCYLTPSITKGLEQICKITTIPHDYIPDLYDKVNGDNTPNCFSAGANLMIEGFVDNVVKSNNIDPKKVIITGGDAFKFGNINKKYKEVKNVVLLGLKELVKEKNW